MERAAKEMTTLRDDGVYYALNNEQEHSMSYPSPKPVPRQKDHNDDSPDEYVNSMQEYK